MRGTAGDQVAGVVVDAGFADDSAAAGLDSAAGFDSVEGLPSVAGATAESDPGFSAELDVPLGA